ncbi:hypothetical protein CRE_01913 [Caenorhabditis remanei]|uniref:Uncharacterized protein n=1 Tax=Caenorhabditis remanei TaxID=31234 RepID=E3LG97_CAERE|nr:hypothetical protein CRE_01913 [Caenorhabditis remanei]
MSSSVFLLLMAIIPIAHSGVLLTYPQARFPPLDYLPDDLTMPPCGVPKPTKPFYTTFHIGSEYNVSWITPASTNDYCTFPISDRLEPMTVSTSTTRETPSTTAHSMHHIPTPEPTSSTPEPTSTESDNSSSSIFSLFLVILVVIYQL